MNSTPQDDFLSPGPTGSRHGFEKPELAAGFCRIALKLVR
jgi:hypothetical protein